MGDEHGIKIYDVDMKNGRLKEKGEVLISNSSYVTISHNGKNLYSITDFGVESFAILKDGTLETINKASINGMRGCYLSTDYEDKYLFCAGYHDGKITVLKLDQETGAVGTITDDKGTLKAVDIIRCELETAPRHLKFSIDGKYMYVIGEMKNCIDVYAYTEVDGLPYFDQIQSISTTEIVEAQGVAASALMISEDGKYIVASNAGENSVSLFEIDSEEGKLTRRFCLPISGEYPKDACLFPDNRHLVSLNHESNTMTFFRVDMENDVIVMNGKEMKIKQPNCIIFHTIEE